MFRVAVLAIALFVVSRPAEAQNCVDFRGIPVTTVMAPTLNDVAMAGWAQNGAPVIYYNPNVLAQMPPATRVFFFGHECAHHALAHGVRNIPFQQEQEADCWSIRMLIAQGALTWADVPVIQRSLSFSPGDWTHLPGPRRAFNLAACLQ